MLLFFSTILKILRKVFADTAKARKKDYDG